MGGGEGGWEGRGSGACWIHSLHSMRCPAQVELAARQLCILQIIMGLFMGGQKQMEEREVLCIHTDG